MKTAIFFATREGQTSKIAARIANDLRAHAIEVDAVDVKVLRSTVDWSPYASVFVAASIHAGRHEPEMIQFVRRYRDQLERRRAVFISVSLSEAGAEDVHAPTERRRRSAADVQQMVARFVKDTGWQPERTLPVAGALAYSTYNILVRLMMKWIARSQGAPTDTSRDYEFTDWPALDRFVDEVLEGSSAR
jgi:menaquinone-dependent protoporphyrinogen oxidase